MTVIGVDAYTGGWVAVAIDDGGYVGSFLAPDIAAVEAEGARRWGVQTIVVDIPIGIPDAGARQADVEARRFIKPRGASVFPTPVRAALEASTYAEARVASVAASGKSLSAQAFAIAPRILDVDAHLALASARILEGHPEVSFRAMAGRGIEEPKKSFDGARLRMDLLEAEGIVVPRA